jgi:TRAP-type C4-dicarboxylate transport system substrate-binding protein
MAAIAAAALTGWIGGAAAEETLLFATGLPPVVHLNAQVLHPWAARVNAAGKGALRLDVRDGPTLATPINAYQRVVDDVAQVAWGLQTYAAGKFPRSEVLSLPFVIDKSEDAAVAFWRLYKSGALDAEYDQIVALMVVAFPPGGLHMAKPLRTLDNLNGVKLGTVSRSASQAVAALGGTPISLASQEMYEGVQRGTVDGLVQVWTAFQPFKLAEVTSYHVDTLLGGAPAMVFMAKKRYQALPAAARQAIDDHSGEAQTRLFGAFWDRVNAEGRNAVAASGKHKIVTLSPEQNAAWQSRLAAITADWVKTQPDGEKILAAFRRHLADVKAGK